MLYPLTCFRDHVSISPSGAIAYSVAEKAEYCSLPARHILPMSSLVDVLSLNYVLVENFE